MKKKITLFVVFVLFLIPVLFGIKKSFSYPNVGWDKVSCSYGQLSCKMYVQKNEKEKLKFQLDKYAEFIRLADRF